MRLTIKENINITQFLESLLCVIGPDGIVNNPKSVESLVKIYVDKSGVPIGISIDSKRIYLQEPWDDTSKFYLDCQENISFDHIPKAYTHNKFTFNFEISDKKEIYYKKFRVDYNPKQNPPLHAHDHNYELNNKHLEYPGDVKLMLPAIDIVTTLSILQSYIPCPIQYPLDSKYSNKYNGIIRKARSEYDDYF